MRVASLASLLALTAACTSSISGSGGGGSSSTSGATGGAATTSTSVVTASTSSVSTSTASTSTTSTTSATAGCEPGVACSGGFCAGTGTSCTQSCTCDASGQWDCTLKTDAPACPAVHPACGQACDSAHLGGFSCMCTGGSAGTATPCSCESGAWQCTPPPDPAHPCPALGRCGRGRTCADFPVGLVCDLGECTCRAMCGTQLWDCGFGP